MLEQIYERSIHWEWIWPTKWSIDNTMVTANYVDQELSRRAYKKDIIPVLHRPSNNLCVALKQKW
jgi:hypothetical protein